MAPKIHSYIITTVQFEIISLLRIMYTWINAHACAILNANQKLYYYRLSYFVFDLHFNTHRKVQSDFFAHSRNKIFSFPINMNGR